MACCSLLAARDRDAPKDSELPAHLTIIFRKAAECQDNIRKPERGQNSFAVARERELASAAERVLQNG
jgi:hypothetical protein